MLFVFNVPVYSIIYLINIVCLRYFNGVYGLLAVLKFSLAGL